jgi:hypothetical protein
VSKEKSLFLTDKHRKKCDLVGVIGREAFHIFDKANMTWIAAIEELGYAKLVS